MTRRAATIAFAALGIFLIAAVAGFAILNGAASPDSLEARFDGGLREKTGGLYRVTLDDTSYDLGRRTFTFSRFRVAPDSLELERRLEAGEAPKLTFTLEADALRLSGVDVGALARGDIVASTATLETPVARVLVNRHNPSEGERRPARMPHELLTSMPRTVRIDTLAIKNGNVTYSEIPLDNTRPGSISFENVWAAIYDLVSDPEPGFEAPCRIDLRTLLAGEGTTEITIVYDLTSPRLDLTYQGTISRMPATAFNEILVDLEGLRVKSGVHDSTWFSFDVKGDVATGQVQVLYHGLESEVIEKVSNEQGLSEELSTLIGDFKIRDANPPDDEPAIVVPVQRERLERENFFRFLWVIVRTGLYETLGVTAAEAQ